MLLHLTEYSSEPIHHQISRQLIDRILDGDLSHDDEMVSIRSLARSCRVSVQTVAKAYDRLEELGLIRAQGSGFFVQPLTEEQRAAIQRQQQMGKASPLNVVESLSRALSAVFDPEKLMTVVLETVQTALGTSAMDFVLHDDRTGDFRLVHAQQGFSVTGGDPVVQALEQIRTPVHLAALRIPPAAGVMAGYLIQQQRQVLVPLHEGEQFIGFWALAPKASDTRYSREDLNLLTVLAHQFVTALVTARFYVEAVEKRRIEEELDLARQIQAGLLPESLPENDAMRMAGLAVPSRQVGGDFFDVIELDNRRWGLVIADVCGKGLPAALMASQMQAMLRSELHHDDDLTAVLHRLNSEVRRSTQRGQFVTLFLGLFDVADGRLTYVNAGHNLPLFRNADGEVQELDVSGPALGLMDEAVYEAASLKLSAGEVLLLYTDGITEAMNHERREFGEAALRKLWQQADAQLMPQTLIEQIQSAVSDFTQDQSGQDDQTLLILQVPGQKHRQDVSCS